MMSGPHRREHRHRPAERHHRDVGHAGVHSQGQSQRHGKHRQERAGHPLALEGVHRDRRERHAGPCQRHQHRCTGGRAGHPEHCPDPLHLRAGFCYRRSYHHGAVPHQAHRGWAQIQADIQTDALGAIEALATALKDGDLESLGLWAASYFWQACTKEQQAQINSIALGALNQLGSALSGVFGNLSQLAMGLVAQFVPAAASATAGQTA